MTYTFKLARRLAVSRHSTMLPVLLVLAACGGDATAPEAPTESPTSGTARPRDITPVTVQVNPSSVTLETNQLIQFRAHGRTSAGDSVDAAVTWSTSGGAILPDGRFSAAAIGTYTVIGLSRVRGNVQVDSSLVTVVRRATNLVAVEVTPTSVSLSPGVSHTFTAVGRLVGGSVVPIGVNWGATGGSIDAGGTFVAGDTAGTYKVTATNTAGTLADTVSVTITAPPAPPPPPAPTPPPPEPVLAKVTLWPATVTLAPGATRQFVTYGRTTTGDSVSVAVVFRATGGTVTSGGLFTAGSTGGSYRIIATAGTLADTSAITVTTPLGSGTPGGSLHFGPFALPADSMGKPGWPAYNATMLPGSASSLTDLRKIQAARGKIVLMVPRAKSLIPTDPAEPQEGVISVAKATEYINTWPDSIAIAPYIADGTLHGVQVSDDITGERIWGPCAPCLPQVDSIALAVKQRLGSRVITYVRANAQQLAGPDGLTGRPYTWKWLRGNWNQYSHLENSSRFGPVGTYLANMLAANDRILTADGRRMCQIYGLNVLSGGDGSSGVRGGATNTGELLWQMSGTEIVDAYTALLPYTTLAVHWSWGPKWYPGFEDRADVVDAMLKVRALANNTPAKGCAP